MDAKERIIGLLEDIDLAPENSSIYGQSAAKRAEAIALIESHDLVPVDSGPFRPEEHGWTKDEDGIFVKEHLQIYSNVFNIESVFVIIDRDQDRLVRLAKWPSTALALLLLKELGIGGGK